MTFSGPPQVARYPVPPPATATATAPASQGSPVPPSERLMASECSTFDVNTNYDFGSADDQPQSNNALLFETDPQNRYQELRSNTSYRPRPTVSAPTVGT